MKFAIQINSAPWRGGGCDTAYQFIKAALRGGHEVVRVFFYGEGAYNGMRWTAAPEEERARLRRWSALAAEHGVDLVICISAAARRGMLEQAGAEEAGRIVAEGFRVAGLGLWMEACLEADRFLFFGG